MSHQLNLSGAAGDRQVSKPPPQKKLLVSKSLAILEECGLPTVLTLPPLQIQSVVTSVSEYLSHITLYFVSYPRSRGFSSLHVMLKVFFKVLRVVSLTSLSPHLIRSQFRLFLLLLYPLSTLFFSRFLNRQHWSGFLLEKKTELSSQIHAI